MPLSSILESGIGRKKKRVDVMESLDELRSHWMPDSRRSLSKVISSMRIEEKVLDHQRNLNKRSNLGVNEVMRPLRIFLLLFGRFPFHPPKAQRFYDENFLTLPWVYFALTSVFLLGVLILSTIGFISVSLGWEFGKNEFHEEEYAIFLKNLIPFVLFWTCLIQGVVGSWTYFLNKRSIVKYLNHWIQAMDILDLQVPTSLRRFLISSNIWFTLFLFAVCGFYFIRSIPLARGGSALISILTLRQIFPGLHRSPDFGGFRAFGLFVLMYTIFACRSFLLLFAFKTRLLRHGFKVWNERLHAEFTTRRELREWGEKETCEKLYAHHCLLLKLVKEQEEMFGGTLQSYYAMQILNLCFELYYLARSGTFSSGSEERPEYVEIIPAVILLIQNVSIFFTLSLDAAYVNEEAYKGFEILRSNGIHPSDSLYRKHLVFNLQASFAQRIVLTGGKYFSIDRPFIVTIFGAVFTYFVIILQLSPNVHKSEHHTSVGSILD